ncbi:hypothetical protein K9K77_02170 [Candidatus Babeliales bacterium]|nr:hypothetical protein [Candidatus Babeliales bacterium]
MIVGIGYALLSGILYSSYTINAKKSADRIIVFFWVNVITYLCYLGMFYFKDVILQHDRHPLEHLIHNVTLTDIPFYFLMACCWVGSLIIFDYMLKHNNCSLVIPVSHMGILITTLGYILLGKQFTTGELIGNFLIFCGATISAYQHISLLHLFKGLKKIPLYLLLSALCESLLVAGSHWMTFLCTHKTTITQEIQEWAQHLSHHIHGPAFGFHNPFYYNIGVRFFIVVIFILYIIFFTKLKNELLPILYKNLTHILLISFYFAGFIITYHSAFLIFKNQSVLTVISKAFIPITLLASYIFLGEKITKPILIGTVFIICGGILNFIF